MGISFGFLEKLRAGGLLQVGSRVLDIGSSNLYDAQAGQLLDFVSHYAPMRSDAKAGIFAERLARGSAYDPATGGLNEAFAGELLNYCGINYLSFDIAAGYKTEIFDLNRQKLPNKYRSAFDVVINCGTTEHVLNQYNSFEVIHDAARVGGHIVHSLPVAGFTDHAYFVYTGRMFFDLAGYNGYEIVDLCYDGVTNSDDLLKSVRSYKSYFPKLADLATQDPIKIPNCSLTIIYRKTKSAPFKACLETSTSVGAIPADVHSSYQADGQAAAAEAAAANTVDAEQGKRRNFWPWKSLAAFGVRRLASRS